MGRETKGKGLKAMAVVLFGLGFLLAMGATGYGQDTISPLAIGDLKAEKTDAEFELTWSAPGDDGTIGMCAGYDIRYATYMAATWEGITNQVLKTATTSYGYPETKTIGGLELTSPWFFWVKAKDEVPNWSEKSNTAGYAPSGLVGRWEFNEGSGETIGDSSGLGNNGQLHNVQWIEISENNWGLLFDESKEGYGEVPDCPTLNIKEGTISCWVYKFKALPSHEFICDKGYDADEGAYGLEIRSGERIQMDVYDTSGDDYDREMDAPSAEMIAGVWYHIVTWYSIEDAKEGGYFNGKKLPVENEGETGGYPLSSTFLPLYIGCSSDERRYFDGVLKDLQIYNVVLSSSEVQNIYETTKVAWETGYAPPGGINDLKVEKLDGTVRLTWSAPGEDGTVGTLVPPAEYWIAYSSYPATWDEIVDAGQVIIESPTQGPGGTELFEEALPADVQACWVRTKDARGAFSGVSNIATFIPPGLVAFWDFEEPAGSTYYKDSTDYHNDGVVVYSKGSPLAFEPSQEVFERVLISKDNHAAKLIRGAGIGGEVPKWVTLMPREAITLSAWVNCDSPPDDAHQIMTKQYRLAVLGGMGVEGRVYLDDGTKFSVEPEGVMEKHKWNHIAMTYDTAKAKLIVYVNGEIVAEETMEDKIGMCIETGLDPVHWNTEGDGRYEGYVDKVSIYHNVAFTPDEIKAMYGTTLGLAPPGEITDLEMEELGAGEIKLTWSAPGADMNGGGLCDHYSIIHATSNPAQGAVEWEVLKATCEVKASAIGDEESETISELDPDAPHFFRVKAFDDVVVPTPQYSLSNIVPEPELVPPGKIENLAAAPATLTTVEGKKKSLVKLTWTAPGDNGTVGTAKKYILNPSLTDKGLFCPVLNLAPDGSGLCSLKFWVTTFFLLPSFFT